jgi:hypothetical protein
MRNLVIIILRPTCLAANSTHNPFYCAIAIECLLRRTLDSLEKRVVSRSQGHFAAALKRRTRDSHHSKSWEIWGALLLEAMELGNPPMPHRKLNKYRWHLGYEETWPGFLRSP